MGTPATPGGTPGGPGQPGNAAGPGMGKKSNSTSQLSAAGKGRCSLRSQGCLGNCKALWITL